LGDDIIYIENIPKKRPLLTSGPFY